MKRLILLASLILGACTNNTNGKSSRYVYNVQAILTEKYQDTEYHFVCQDIETNKTFTWEWGNTAYPDVNYKKRKIGDTLHFEFLGTHRFVD